MNYLDVTQEDIDKAEAVRGNDWLSAICPIAQSMKRAGLIKPRARIEALYTSDGEFARVTNSMERFMTRFDKGKPVKPHRFRLVKP